MTTIKAYLSSAILVACLQPPNERPTTTSAMPWMTTNAQRLSPSSAAAASLTMRRSGWGWPSGLKAF